VTLAAAVVAAVAAAVAAASANEIVFADVVVADGDVAYVDADLALAWSAKRAPRLHRLFNCGVCLVWFESRCFGLVW